MKFKAFTTARPAASAGARLKTGSALGACLLASALMASTAHAQTTFYNATTLPTTAETGVVNYLQDLTLAGGAGSYTVNSFQLGVNFDTGTEDDYGAIVTFYSGLNTSNSAADVLGTATYLGGVEGTLQDPSGSGNYTYTFTVNSPITFSTPDGTVGVEIQLTDSTFDDYSDDMNARFSTVPPTTGGSPGYVWNDADGDGTFSSSEKTTFGLSGAYTRLSLTGVAPAAVSAAPEPSTWALMILGLGGIGYAFRRAKKDHGFTFAGATSA